MRPMILISFLLLSSPATLFGQSEHKIPLTHNVYDSWSRVTSETISNDGAWVAYILSPQEGDPVLITVRLADGSADTVRRGANPTFSEDSRFLIFSITAPFLETKKAREAKAKSDDFPKDSVGIIELGSMNMNVIPRTKAFTLPEKGSGWVAIRLEKEITPKDSSVKGAGGNRGDQRRDENARKTEKGSTVVLHELESGREYRFPSVDDYSFSRPGNRILLLSGSSDSAAHASALVFDTNTRAVDTLARGGRKFTSPAWDEDGTQAAFVADRDTSRGTRRFAQLLYWKPGFDSATTLVDSTVKGVRTGWTVSGDQTPRFSRNGERLLFGTAPVPLPDDTAMSTEDRPRLDVWNWRDGEIQSEQIKRLDQERKRSYTAVANLHTGTFTQLGDSALPRIETGNEGNAGVALGLSDLPYRRMSSWEGDARYDVYLVDITTGLRTRVLERTRGPLSLSPGGRYVTWYDRKARHWFTLDAQTHRQCKATAGITVPLYDELNDVPDDPRPHGMLGWLGQDSLLLVYDKYDVWAVDPAGNTPPCCLTQGTGRRDEMSYRYMRLDPDERFLKRDSLSYFRIFSFKDKSSGYASLQLDGRSLPRRLLMDRFNFSPLRKARNANLVILTKSNFTTFPDLYVGYLHLRSLRRLSNGAQQQSRYRWGTVELIHWTAGDGKPIDGLLYKPDDFDPSSKYPMIVYYYERNSDLLHTYIPPAPSRSTINRTYCVSNGYLVFVPDIRYRIGHPGRSAVECIVTGVRDLIRRGFVDSTRIALQGQSWGGYQTAFLVTQSSLFRCAFAGAPVANMTSAYGGIRWESGLVREFQYEQEQSRIGSTLWKKRDLYIANSPLFFVDRVTTPLLIMHNDKDGAVPWYQGIELFTALRRLGKPAWMLVYNDEAHNLTQRKNMKDLSIRMMQFFDHYLKSSPPPVWMVNGIPAIDKSKTLGYEPVNPPGGENNGR